jgi:hypothetical protein
LSLDDRRGIIKAEAFYIQFTVENEFIETHIYPEFSGRQEGILLPVFHIDIIQRDLPGKGDVQATDIHPGLQFFLEIIGGLFCDKILNRGSQNQ